MSKTIEKIKSVFQKISVPNYVIVIIVIIALFLVNLFELNDIPKLRIKNADYEQFTIEDMVAFKNKELDLSSVGFYVAEDTFDEKLYIFDDETDNGKIHITISVKNVSDGDSVDFSDTSLYDDKMYHWGHRWRTESVKIISFASGEFELIDDLNSVYKKLKGLVRDTGDG